MNTHLCNGFFRIAESFPGPGWTPDWGLYRLLHKNHEDFNIYMQQLDRKWQTVTEKERIVQGLRVVQAAVTERWP